MKWSTKHMVRDLAKGGILTPSYLLKILDIAKSCGNTTVHFGSRQDLLFLVSKNKMSKLKEAFVNLQTDYIIHGQNGIEAQNIVSSYAASDMTSATNWLKSGNYLNILENFNFLPTLRINISDPRQSLVPLFYGHLNFVASTVIDYWYLFIRKDFDSLPECWPVLILSTDIARLSKSVESNWHILEKAGIVDLYDFTQNELNYNSRRIEIKYKAENLAPHDYEGFGRMYNSSGFWAGFYWRNNCYDIPFLEEVCQLSIRFNISRICLTPWKSFLIKDIKEKDLIHWQRLLGRYGINMRHSSFELNWHLPLEDQHALKLKRFIVKKFDKADVCVHGITFGIKTKPEPSFCTIRIEKERGIFFLKHYSIFNTYKISFAKQFNTNTCEYREYSSQVPRNRLPEELHQLTLKYYSEMTGTHDNIIQELKIEKVDTRIVHQCPHCLTVYNENTGPLSFKLLPETYTCPLCDAPKAEYKPVLFNALIKNEVV